MLCPAIACSVNLYPLVEELRCEKKPAETGKCAPDVLRSPAAKVANNYGGAMNQWKAALIEVVAITGNKNTTQAQCFGNVISSGWP
jgi:hypothetical protein